MTPYTQAIHIRTVPPITYLRLPTLEELSYLDSDEAERLLGFIKQADALFHECGIGVDRNKEPLAVALHDENVVGVVSAGFGDDTFGFDVAVHPDYRTGIIGTKLARMGDKEYMDTRDECRDAFGERYHARLWVVEPRFVRFFERLGYTVVSQHDSGRHTFMEKW
jgi:hypothetical protein